MSKRGPHPDYLTLLDAAETADAGEYCGVVTRRGTACRRPAGWGTEHAGGPCRDHRSGTRLLLCPLPLSKLEEGLWNDLSLRLQELRLLKPAFWPTIYGLVIALATLHDAREELDAIAVPDRGAGVVKKNPAAVVAHQMLVQVRQYLQELGLTPSALSRIPGPPNDDGPKTRMEQLIRGRRR